MLRAVDIALLIFFRVVRAFLPFFRAFRVKNALLFFRNLHGLRLYAISSSYSLLRSFINPIAPLIAASASNPMNQHEKMHE